ncbi:MAG: hypothetical protein WA118_04570 [Carboxydocellales bacterium]
MQIVAEIERLKQRIEELEEKVERLRFSRRVLMNLLERIEYEHRDCLLRLEKQNQKLKHNNYRFATDLLYKNKRIIELEK